RLNETASAPQPQAQAAAPAAPAAEEPADPAKEKLYYDAAFDLIKAKDFDKASQAFSAFLRRYPASRYAANARYWLGEIHLVKGDLQAAGQSFARVTLDYPNHSKVPDALYKLADVERRLGRTDKARAALQEVIAKYPDTSAAKLAERDLMSLRCPPTLPWKSRRWRDFCFQLTVCLVARRWLKRSAGSGLPNR